ncbi:MAG TPA: YihY/virulence factor BrkB family protein [bacterium]|nr:YihY/virulence factor BrkB family protein [bacterium]
MVDLFKKTFFRWMEIDPFKQAAALAYVTLFSMAPTLLIVMAVAGWVFDQAAVKGHIFGELRGFVGDEAARAMQTLVEKAAFSGKGTAATLWGILLVLIGATGTWAYLKSSLNQIWCVKAKPVAGQIKDFFFTRLLSIGMLIAIGFLMLVSLAISAALNAFGAYLAWYLAIPEWFLPALNTLWSVVFITLVFALIFKVMPDVKLCWGDVWIGGLFTSLLFTGGKQLIALYLGQSSVTSVYGAAGSLVILMLWVYYSALILFLGAAFTKAYADYRKVHIAPTDQAVPVHVKKVLVEGSSG